METEVELDPLLQQETAEGAPKGPAKTYFAWLPTEAFHNWAVLARTSSPQGKDHSYGCLSQEAIILVFLLDFFIIGIWFW